MTEIQIMWPQEKLRQLYLLLQNPTTRAAVERMANIRIEFRK